MKQLLIFLLSCLPVLTASASNADSALVEHRSMWRQTDAAARLNPALHGVAFDCSYSELTLNLDLRSQSEAFVEELGKGYTLPSAAVETYLRLSGHTAVWGAASYMTGRQRQVKWNSTSDYHLLQPYVLADTLGGNTQRERYAFSGGYATRLSQWLLGAEMLFRAEQEYRDQDPRMRGVVTDLTLRIGAARQLAAYRIGAAFEGNFYKQTNSVAFYNEEGVIPEYQMTGLGTDYKRFSGDKRSIYYEGGGVALLLSAAPVGDKGFYVDLSLDEHRYHRKLAEYNSMPLTDLFVDHVGAAVGWLRQQNRERFSVSGRVDYTRRTGDERVVGTSEGNAYPTVASLSMYKNNITDVAVETLYGRSLWNVSLCGGYQNVTERYAWPQRQLDYSRAYGRLDGQLMAKPAKEWLLTVSAHAAYIGNLNSTVVMPYANMEAALIDMVNHRRDYAIAGYTDLGAGVRADYAWADTRYGLFAELQGAMLFCSTSERQTDFRATIGITF